MAKICLAVKRKPEYEAVVNAKLPGHRLTWLEDLSEQERRQEILGCDALVVTMLTKELTFDEKGLLNRVPFVQTIAAGADQFDFSAVPHDALICSNIGGWAPTMAEHALAMAFSCLRKLGDQKEAMKDGTYHRLGWGLRRIRGKRVLIVGYGGIGRACREVFAAQGCLVAAVSRHKPTDPLLDGGAWDMSGFLPALSQADIIIACLPSTTATAELFGQPSFQAMKENATFINLARAALVDRQALLKKLLDCPEFHAAIDPWWEEEHVWDGSDPLIRLPNVVASCHTSFDSETSWPEAIGMALDNLIKYLNGEPYVGRVNFSEYVKEA